MSRRRLPSFVMACALATLGCVHAGSSDPGVRPVTTYFAEPERTEAGRSLADQLAAHPGESGLLVLGQGLDAFAARVLMIDAAEAAIDVQYYIFHDDLTGRLLLSRLLAAADRGVRVRLLLDDLGSPGLDPLLAAANAHPHLEVRLFNALARGPWPGLARGLDLLARPLRLNHRMHNKMLAVDGLAAVVGGRNVGDEYFDADPSVNFADTDLLAFGPVLQELGASFDLYWNSEHSSPVSGWRRLRAGPEALDALRSELAEHEASAASSPYAERVRTSSLYLDAKAGRIELLWAPTHAVADHPDKIVARGEALQRTLLSEQIGDYFDEARSELLIASPYFVPRESGVAYLAETTGRGARVGILTNSLAATDVSAVHSAYAPYREAMVEAGVELYELKATGAAHRHLARRGLLGSSSASLHAKTFVFDREVVFVGTLNLDPRSIDLNTEIGLVVQSRTLAEERAASFERATAPELSWKLGLDERGLVWRGTESGERRELRRDPDSSFGRRAMVWLLGWLPIEGQL